jgi:Uma2 family endonuclease
VAPPASRIYFTPEEYLAFERESEERHEYSAGHLFLVAGESRNHSRICVNLSREVSAALKGGPCEAFLPSMKVRGSRATKFSYPDLMVVCGEPVFHDEHGDAPVDAKVIFEVLSPSTEAYNRGKKFLRYRSIETDVHRLRAGLAGRAVRRAPGAAAQRAVAADDGDGPGEQPPPGLR